MKIEVLDQQLAQPAIPWGPVIGNLRHRIANRTDKTKIRQMIMEECIREGVEFPPLDIEETILTLIFEWMLEGAPAPVEKMV